MARITVIYEKDQRPPLQVHAPADMVRIASIDIGQNSVADLNVYAVAQKLAELLLEQLAVCEK
ncbi:MAG TPA: hypothetical protein VKS24_24890 [Bradyrhizobium sp.]|nr:hypothetical protein [Bradyrhizobium sp.]